MKAIEKSYVFPVKNSQTYPDKVVLGVRIFFPERHANSYAIIEPPFEIPIYYDTLEKLTGKGDAFLYKGVVRNVGVLRKLSVLALGSNFRYTLYVRVKDHKGEEKDIFVGLMERFDESMVLLKALRANNLNISYRLVNVARKNSLAENLLSAESTRQMLIEANQADLELYNFARKELYPSFQREYGSQLEKDVSDYQQNRDKNFNMWNLTLSRLKQYLIYRPLLSLYRKGIVAV